jgi:hypothetical protein
MKKMLRNKEMVMFVLMPLIMMRRILIVFLLVVKLVSHSLVLFLLLFNEDGMCFGRMALMDLRSLLRN